MSNRLRSVLLAFLLSTGSLMAAVSTVPGPASALTISLTSSGDFNGSGGNKAALDDVVVEDGAVRLGVDTLLVHDLAWTEGNKQNMVVDKDSRPVLAPASHWKTLDGYGSDGEFWHTAVWDKDNAQVLVYGGYHQSGGNQYIHSELWAYDPARDSWTQLSSGIQIMGHTAVWADDYHMMVVYGGLAVSGQNNVVYMDRVLCYWPANDSWGWRARSPTVHTWHAAAWDSVNDQMLVSGGSDDFNWSNSTDALYAWRPATDTWVQLTGMGATFARGGHTAVFDTDRNEMIVSGGIRRGNPMSSTMVYKVATDSWNTRANCPIGKFVGAASWDPINNKMYTYGGLDDSGRPTARFYQYTNAGDSWTDMETGPFGRYLNAFVWDPIQSQGLNFMGAQSGNFFGATSYNDIYKYAKETPYQTEGWLTSSYFDTGGILGVGNLTWKPSQQPAQCGDGAVKFQVGSSGPLDFPSEYVGPDGKTWSYFTDPSPTPVGSSHYGMNRIAYRMYFHTADTSITPTVTEVSMEVYRYKTHGTYTSPILDLGQPVSTIGRIRYTVEVPTGGNVNLIKGDVMIRASTRPDMSGASVWERVDPDDTKLTTPYARYMQFKVDLYTDSQARYLTPRFKDFTIEYNSPPVLNRAQIDRSEGFRDTWFQYTITYTDVDNDAPTLKNVVVDGTKFMMSSADTDFTNGAVFTYQMRLPLGEHAYYFEFSDGKNPVRDPLFGSYAGPTVLNRLPIPVIEYPQNGQRYSPDEPIEFSASRSSDPDAGDLLTYRWVSSIQGLLSEHSAFVMKLQVGDHVITLQVTDDKGGTNATQIGLKVKPYLPALDVTDIYFDNANPVEKDKVTVTAVVRNTGEADARPAFVDFLIDRTLVETKEENLDIDGRANIVFVWTATAGKVLVSVRARYSATAEPDSEVERFINVSANSVPIIDYNVPLTKVKRGEPVTFINNGTKDPNSDAITFEWDFGDGSLASKDATVQHVFDLPGVYYVNLTVKDSRGGVAKKQFVIAVTKPKVQSPGFEGMAAIAAVVAIGALMASGAAVGRRSRRRRDT
jgi:PKD repeat protein